MRERAQGCVWGGAEHETTTFGVEVQRSEFARAVLLLLRLRPIMEVEGLRRSVYLSVYGYISIGVHLYILLVYICTSYLCTSVYLLDIWIRRY